METPTFATQGQYVGENIEEVSVSINSSLQDSLNK